MKQFSVFSRSFDSSASKQGENLILEGPPEQKVKGNCGIIGTLAAL